MSTKEYNATEEKYNVTAKEFVPTAKANSFVPTTKAKELVSTEISITPKPEPEWIKPKRRNHVGDTTTATKTSTLNNTEKPKSSTWTPTTASASHASASASVFSSYDPSTSSNKTALQIYKDINKMCGETTQKSYILFNENGKRHVDEQLTEKDINNMGKTYDHLDDDSSIEELLDEMTRTLEFNLSVDTPECAYRRHSDDEKSISGKYLRHWGQLKLIMSEIQFLTKIFKLQGKKWINRVVVYAGGAPGTHVPYLSKLFPELKFILVDPSPFDFTTWHTDEPECHEIINNTEDEKNCKYREINERCNIYTINGYMTPELSSIFTKFNPIFISDIRSISSDFDDDNDNDASGNLAELSVFFDNFLQMEILKTMNPIYSLLKSRCTYGDNLRRLIEKNEIPLEYKNNKHFEKLIGEDREFHFTNSLFPSGIFYYQCWQGKTSTESRLFVERQNNTRIISYNNKKFENQFFYFNNIQRMSYYPPIVKIISSKQFDLLNYSFDMHLHTYILLEYMLSSTGNLRFIDQTLRLKTNTKQIDLNIKELQSINGNILNYKRRLLQIIKILSDDLCINITKHGKRDIQTIESKNKKFTLKEHSKRY